MDIFYVINVVSIGAGKSTSKHLEDVVLMDGLIGLRGTMSAPRTILTHPPGR